MANKNNYTDLDEVGFIGVNEERSKAQIDKDAKATSEVIRKYRSGKAAIGNDRARNTIKRPSGSGQKVAGAYSK